MSNDEVGRRGILKLFGSVPLAAGFALTGAQAQAAHEHAREEAKAGKAGPYTPKFFSAHEWAMVRVLVDIVIPRDERSGSATDALVPEFMDYILNDPLAEPRQRERHQTRMRGGLAWLDRECGEAGAEPGRGFLQRLPGPDGLGLLEQQDGRRRPQVHWEHLQPELERLPARGSREAGFGQGLEG